MMGSDDGSMSPVYNVSTINGSTLGFGEPLRVKQGQRVLMHIVNTSATEPHWLALSGHSFAWSRWMVTRCRHTADSSDAATLAC